MIQAPEQVGIRINGEAKRVPANQSVAAILAILELPADRVAVELNRAIVRQRDWAHTLVPAEASLEVVEFVGGG